MRPSSRRLSALNSTPLCTAVRQRSPAPKNVTGDFSPWTVMELRGPSWVSHICFCSFLSIDRGREFNFRSFDLGRSDFGNLKIWSSYFRDLGFRYFGEFYFGSLSLRH